MGFLAFPILFIMVWAICDSLLGSPWGLILAILFGFVIPAIVLTAGILADREHQRELNEMLARRPTSPRSNVTSIYPHRPSSCPAGPDCPHEHDVGG
jgi:hypothetical protein